MNGLPDLSLWLVRCSCVRAVCVVHHVENTGQGQVLLSAVVFGGNMLNNVGSISVGVYITHSVVIRTDAIRAVFNLLVWLLRSQAGQQYAVGAKTSAIVDFLRVLKSAPQVVSARRLIAPTRES